MIELLDIYNWQDVSLMCHSLECKNCVLVGGPFSGDTSLRCIRVRRYGRRLMND